MTRHRSIVRLAAVAVTATLVAAACGGDDDDVTTAAVAPATTETTVVEAASATDEEATETTETTAAPTTTAAPPEDADPAADDTLADDTAVGDPAEAAAAAWSAVFDSSVPFEDKAPHLADAEALRSTAEAYAGTGNGMGGISLAPSEVVVDGDTATVTYDVLFGGNAAYEDQTGSISLVDGTWVVSRDEFCSFMSSARTPCPAA
ncbi:MAG TPA: hypothetical protein VK866_09070 [Acidimicrobiales bacterium]|nr:hypothetical protein [Acidimicrobiales bacterium]